MCAPSTAEAKESLSLKYEPALEPLRNLIRCRIHNEYDFGAS